MLLVFIITKYLRGVVIVLPNSMVMCLRGARSSCGKPQLAASDISLAVSEARLL